MTEPFFVMSLNLRFGRAADGAHSWDRRKHMLSALFHRHPASFICVQEANDFQVHYLAGLLPDYRFTGHRHNPPAFWQDNAIFYHRRWNLVESDRFFLSHTPDTPSRFAESKWPRQCTAAVFSRGGRQLVVADTHLDFSTKVRVKSVRLILSRLARFAGRPAILAGDFNARPDQPCHRILTGKEPGEPGPPFIDPFEGSFAPTHHGFTGIPNQSTGRIDWILYRGPLACTRCEILHDDFGGKYPSDHFPVYAGFSFTG
ncbi:MAG: endonuclease/exonuclease/phosphatase family protein [Deltaproteobacteria bacterium]|nr:endonuclease/exonuclease/phosphatase family protein [Deltaproteobacteria bacterium]